MEYKITLTPATEQLLQSCGHVVNGKYFFLPYWFEKTDTEGVYKLHNLDSELPAELKEFIEKNRLC